VLSTAASAFSSSFLVEASALSSSFVVEVRIQEVCINKFEVRLSGSFVARNPQT